MGSADDGSLDERNKNIFSLKAEPFNDLKLLRLKQPLSLLFIILQKSVNVSTYLGDGSFARKLHSEKYRAPHQTTERQIKEKSNQFRLFEKVIFSLCQISFCHHFKGPTDVNIQL